MTFRKNLARIAFAGAIAGGGIATTVAALSGSATAGAASSLITSDTLTLSAATGPDIPAAAASFSVSGVSLGINDSVNISSSGAGAGKSTFAPLVVTLRPGLEEPALLKILGTSQPLNVTLDVIVSSAPAGSQPSYMEYDFTKAVLSGDSLIQGGSGGPAYGEVTLTFQYVSETETANIVNQATGTVATASTCWSAANNATCPS